MLTNIVQYNVGSYKGNREKSLRLSMGTLMWIGRLEGLKPSELR